MKKRKYTPYKYKPRLAIDIALLASAGHSNREINQLLGLSPTGLHRWIKDHSLVRYALEAGRAKDAAVDEGDTWKNYVIGHLSPKLRKLWNRITSWSQLDEDGKEKANALLRKQSAHARKALWLYAYMAYGFNASKACRVVGISKYTVDEWRNDDPQFTKLCEELRWHQKNFCESMLMRKVKQGDTNAILFTNRTLNRDRGYGEKVEIDVKETKRVEFVVSVDDLDLPLPLRLEILKAMRAKKALQAQNEAKPALPSPEAGKGEGAAGKGPVKALDCEVLDDD